MTNELKFDDLLILVKCVALFAEKELTLEAAEAELREAGHPHLKLSEWLLEVEERIGGVKSRGNLLVERGAGGRHAVLQKCAHDFAATARQILDLWDDRILEVRTARLRVNVAVSNAIAAYYLPRALLETKFFERYPNVDLKVVEGEPPQNSRRVAQREVHFAVGPKGPVPLNCEFKSLTFWRRGLMINKSIPDHGALWRTQEPVRRVSFSVQRSRPLTPRQPQPRIPRGRNGRTPSQTALIRLPPFRCRK